MDARGSTGVGAGNQTSTADYDRAVITLLHLGGSGAVVKLRCANKLDNVKGDGGIDLNAAISATNIWAFALSENKDSGTPVAGGTGVTLTVDIPVRLEVDAGAIDDIAADIISLAAGGTVTAYFALYNSSQL